MAHALSPKQQAFIDNYIVTSNATNSAIAAGYSEKTAASQGCQLLKMPKVAAEIARRRAPIEKKSALTADRVLQELANIAFVDPGTLFDEHGKLLPLNKMPEETRRAIAGIETDLTGGKVKLSSKLGALELAAKLLGMVKQEQTHQAAVQIIINPPAEPAERLKARNVTPVWDAVGLE